MTDPTPKRGLVRAILARSKAIVLLRCPRCFQGKVFRGSFAMNDPCPVCGIVFQREEGYFLGAMYVSYLLATVFFGCLFFLGESLFPDVNSFLLVGAITVLYLPFVPAVFRYSRVVWMHFERAGCPGELSATAFEKARLKEFEQARNGSPPRDDRMDDGDHTKES
jgi:uncharacterized protein (DUF983 family)